MQVAVIPNRGSPPAILLRESYREAGKTKNRTLANLSRWPAERIEQLRAVLRGDKLLPAAEAVEIDRAPHRARRRAARPHGPTSPRDSPWADGPRHGARLQKSQWRGARLPLTKDRRSRAASGVPLDRTAGARARPALHAGLLSAGAHAPSLAPMLFDEHDPGAREAQRASPVAKAEPSPAARRKTARKRTGPADGEPLPLHSFHTLLGDLATLTCNVVRLGRDRLTTILATPTCSQRHALDLLGVTPHCVDRPTPPLQTISMGYAQKRAKFGLACLAALRISRCPPPQPTIAKRFSALAHVGHLVSSFKQPEGRQCSRYRKPGTSVHAGPSEITLRWREHDSNPRYLQEEQRSHRIVTRPVPVGSLSLCAAHRPPAPSWPGVLSSAYPSATSADG